LQYYTQTLRGIIENFSLISVSYCTLFIFTNLIYFQMLMGKTICNATLPTF
jgi:hypothetical protein